MPLLSELLLFATFLLGVLGIFTKAAEANSGSSDSQVPPRRFFRTLRSWSERGFTNMSAAAWGAVVLLAMVFAGGLLALADDSRQQDAALHAAADEKRADSIRFADQRVRDNFQIASLESARQTLNSLHVVELNQIRAESRAIQLSTRSVSDSLSSTQRELAEMVVARRLADSLARLDRALVIALSLNQTLVDPVVEIDLLIEPGAPTLFRPPRPAPRLDSLVAMLAPFFPEPAGGHFKFRLGPLWRADVQAMPAPGRRISIAQLPNSRGLLEPRPAARERVAGTGSVMLIGGSSVLRLDDRRPSIGWHLESRQLRFVLRADTTVAVLGLMNQLRQEMGLFGLEQRFGRAPTAADSSRVADHWETLVAGARLFIAIEPSANLWIVVRLGTPIIRRTGESLLMSWATAEPNIEFVDRVDKSN